jgi:hypothetical protein
MAREPATLSVTLQQLWFGFSASSDAAIDSGGRRWYALDAWGALQRNRNPLCGRERQHSCLATGPVPTNLLQKCIRGQRMAKRKHGMHFSLWTLLYECRRAQV